MTVTVRMLIDLLNTLPQDALVWESTYHSNCPLEIPELSAYVGPLFVYENSGDVRLYIDDGAAYHPDDRYKTSLFWPCRTHKLLRDIAK